MSATPAKVRKPKVHQTPSPKPRWRIGKGVKHTVAVSSTVIGLAAALITVGVWLAQILPRSGPGITFTNPSPNKVPAVPCVYTVTGRGSPPSGQALVLSNQQQGAGSNADSTMYFAVAKINSGMWNAVLQMGKDSTPGGTRFTLTTWLVNADWVSYLNQVINQRLWWGTPGIPPGAKKIQSVTVTRAAGKCSAG